MAVYTPVGRAELEDYLSRYTIGALQSYEGIAAGVSNTNYYIDTDQGRFILTLFEPHRVRAGDIPFFMAYVLCLQDHQVACPHVMTMQDGNILGTLCARPAAIFSFLPGEGGTAESLSPVRCHAAGALLGRMHRAADRFEQSLVNRFGPVKWFEWARQVGAHEDALQDILAQWPDNLPRGAVHADYFPDNVFFEGDTATGVIDFHFVCTDFYAYDLAIALAAWSFDENNVFQDDRFAALIEGYESVRPLSAAEKQAMPVLLQGAALRFLLSRLEEKMNWTPDRLGQPHDPAVFLERLRHFQT